MTIQRGLFLVLLGLLAVCPTAMYAQDTYQLDSLESYPGAQVSVPFRVSNANPWNALSLSVDYDQFKSTVTHIGLSGVLTGVTPEFMDSSIDVNAGRLTFELILDGQAPYGLVLPAGASQEVAALQVDVSQGLVPGQSIQFGFLNGLGNPPVNNQAEASGVVTIPSLVDGQILISSQNYLIVKDSHAAPGDLGHTVEVLGINTDNVQGFSLVGTFDQNYFHGQQLLITNTITEVVGAEFTETIIDNDHGFFVIGVLLDLIPPFDGQTIPASMLAIPIAKLVGDVLPAAAGIDFIPITLQDGLSTPPVENILVIAQQSVSPQLVPGVIEIENMPVFLRGDANNNSMVDKGDVIVIALYVVGLWNRTVCLAALDADDSGKLDLADAIFILSYLFLSGPVLPEPFPLPGMDPTPSLFPCDL